MNKSLFEKPTQTRFSEQIATQIESLILGDQLRPGQKLPSERELAIQFGVSRTAIRESIKLLEERGLLESLDGRGAFVTALNLDNVASSLSLAYRMQSCSADDLHEARWAVESINARLAAERATDEDIAAMEAAREIMDGAEDDPQRYTAADLQFHAAMASATHNPLLVVMARPLIEMIQTLGLMTFKTGSRAERHQWHSRLLECVKNHDPFGAEEALRQHLNLTKEATEIVKRPEWFVS